MTVVSLVFLTGCANVQATQGSCPQAVIYSSDRWREIEKEVSALPEKSSLIPVLNDYIDLIEKLQVCNI